MEDNAAAPVSFGFGGWKVQKKQKVTQPSEALSHVFGDLTHDINRPSPTFVPGENETDDDHKHDGQNKRKADQDEKQSAQRESKRLQEDGNNLAEAGDFSAALNRWDRAIRLTPQRAVLYELRAQVLMEAGHPFPAVQAATTATELEPLWAEGFLTLGRAQLNYGEISLAISNFEKVKELQPDNAEVGEDLSYARDLLKQKEEIDRKQLISIEQLSAHANRLCDIEFDWSRMLRNLVRDGHVLSLAGEGNDKDAKMEEDSKKD